jgi:hypothetical protein
MSETQVDLSKLAGELEAEARQLAVRADEAKRHAEALAAEPKPEPPLDPHFAENLEKALAEPRERLQRIARSAR